MQITTSLGHFVTGITFGYENGAPGATVHTQPPRPAPTWYLPMRLARSVDRRARYADIHCGHADMRTLQSAGCRLLGSDAV
jgi:hypothetical protein